MNISSGVLLILLVSSCHGEEQIDSNASDIVSTTTAQKAEMEDSCPNPADIEPCVCSNDGQLTMDCCNIQDEQQLWQVFSAYFPSTTFYKFKIWGNEDLSVLENGVFHGVSFQEMYIQESSLQVVEDEALTPSLSTLTSLGIDFCQLDTFPFERLPQFTSLKYLSLEANNILSIPPLSSSTLQSLYLNHNPLSPLQPDTFKGLPAIQRIYLIDCHLKEIAPGTFTDLPELNSLILINNQLSFLQSLTFDIVSSHGDAGFIQLWKNNIDFVEVDTFKGVQEFSKIGMDDNALARLSERTWRPVLEKGINVTFKDNPLTCGCDVAWLVRNPQLLTGAQDGQCVDGKNLTDLDPADFNMCG